MGIHHFVFAYKLDNRVVSNQFFAAYSLLSAFPTQVFTAMRPNIQRMKYHIGQIVRKWLKHVESCCILLWQACF